MQDSEEKNSQEVILEQAFKQFSLETEHLEGVYKTLQEQFKDVQQNLQESHIRLSGKLAELDFVTRYLEAILQHISQGILFIDLNGIVTTYNVAAEEILEAPVSTLLFHSFQDFFEDALLGFSLKDALYTKICPKSSSLIWTAPSGQKKEIDIEATFVAMGSQAYPLNYRQREESSGPIQGLLILMRNVTEMRRLQQLSSRHDRLKSLGELAAHLAHEIRNPLGGIKGFAHLLQQELTERPDLQRMAASIVEGTDHLNHFVSNILNYTRPFQPHFEKVHLVSYLEEIKAMLQADPAWTSAFSFEIHSTEADLTLLLDPQLFKSALLNLFVNARQSMPEGGVVAVSIEQDKDYVRLVVSDTGVGIPPEHLDKIFSPFFTTKETGTGLGLVEVHKVVQAHQGWIEVQSEVGKGSTFIIKIPLKEVL